MTWTPSFSVFQDDGSTPVYTIEDVVRIEGWNYNDAPADFVELINLRSQGSIIIPGGSQPYDITIYARLAAANYTALIAAFNTLKSAITTKTHFYLKIDISNVATNDIKVVRLQPITIDTGRGNLNKFLYYNLILRANAWS